METRIVEFRTDLRAHEYTKCALNKIVGSIACIKCKHFVAKVNENKMHELTKHFIQTGLVECQYNGIKIR